MRRRIGNDKKIKEWLKMLDENKFNELAAIILKEYYDPLYKHTVDDIKYDFIIEKDYAKKLRDIMK